MSAHIWMSVVEVTVAVRGPPSSSAISPKKSPSFRWLTRLPPIVTSASPVSITNKPAPGSPSVAITVPAGCEMSRTVRAMAVSSFLEQPENMGTFARRATTSFVATVPPERFGWLMLRGNAPRVQPGSPSSCQQVGSRG